MDDTELLHAIDRALTDLLPDKHQYEADLQLYLDYSLPSHPELPSMEEEQLSKHSTDANSADDFDLERDWPDGMGELEQQALHGHDKQLAVVKEYSVEESSVIRHDAQSATDVWPGTASELNDNADDCQALRDLSAAAEHLHHADESRDQGPRGESDATPKGIPRAGVHESFSQADGAAGDGNDPAVEDGACADSESLLITKEGQALEDKNPEAELLQDQGAVIVKERQASLAHNAKPVAGRDLAAHMPHRSTCFKLDDNPLRSDVQCSGAVRMKHSKCNTDC